MQDVAKNIPDKDKTAFFENNFIQYIVKLIYNNRDQLPWTGRRKIICWT